jgi:hypothetical protein
LIFIRAEGNDEIPWIPLPYSCFPTNNGVIITGTQAGTCNGIAGTFGIGGAVDASGNFYLAGETNGMELPITAGVIQPTTGPEFSTTNQNHVAGIRGLIAKFNPVTTKGGTSLAYVTYPGGANNE